MSRYTCSNCKIEWTTKNMVPVCSDCFSHHRAAVASLKERLAYCCKVLQEKYVELDDIRDKQLRKFQKKDLGKDIAKSKSAVVIRRKK